MGRPIVQARIVRHFVYLLPLFLAFVCVEGQQPKPVRNEIAGRSRVTGSKGEPDRDSPELVLRRELWFVKPRFVPGQQSAELLRKANEFKFQQRALRAEMERVRRQMLSTTSALGDRASTSSVIEPVDSTVVVAGTNAVWFPLGPKPIVADSANDTSNYGNLAGRVSAIAVDDTDTSGNRVFVGGAYGGVWKSTNAASSNRSSVTWTPVIDDQATLAVGAIAVFGNIVLVGTGEAKSAVDSYYGQGILRSTDGGDTWSLIRTADGGATSLAGLSFSHIVFSIQNPGLVVATTLNTGLSLGLGATLTTTTKGVFYSTDSGLSWHSVTVSEGGTTFQASSNGLVYNTNNHLFYAAMRYHGVYSSSDGATWTRLPNQPNGLTTATCPSSISTSCPFWRGEIAAVPGRNEMYVWYADNSYTSQGVFRTLDGGTTWTSLNTANGFDTCDDGGTCSSYQLFYNMTMAAFQSGTEPGATDLYLGSGNIFKCTIDNANPTCGSASVPYKFMDLTHVYGCNASRVHPDQHAIAGSSANSSVIYFGNDGGVYRTINAAGLSTDSCTSALPFDNLNDNLGSLTQLTWATPDPTDAYGVLAGAQDNGSFASGSVVQSNHGLSGQQFFEMMEGDGGHTEIRSDVTPNWWYQTFTDVLVNLCANGSNCGYQDFLASNYITSEAMLGGDLSAFYPPFMVDPQSQTHLLFGTCRMWRGSSGSTAVTAPWGGAAISPNFNNGLNTACVGSSNPKIQSFAVGGPTTANGSQAIYVGMDNGDIWVTLSSDAGATTANWRKIDHINGSAASLITGSSSGIAYGISSMAVDPADATGKTAYAAVQGFGAYHVIKTTDGGVSWTGIASPNGSSGLPDAPANTIMIDPDDHTVIYVGTDVGVFVTSNNGASWTEVGPTEPGGASSGYLPNTVVTHIAMNEVGPTKMLVAATYGRGVWATQLPQVGNSWFVQRCFRDILDRAADPGALTFYTNALRSGLSRPDFVYGVMNSAEFKGREKFVAQAYVAVLQREADYGGFRYYANQVLNGLTQQAMIDQFVSSAEFQSRYGSLDDTQFVTQMYNAILLRPPDPGGLAYYVGKLSSGMTRSQLVLEFMGSNEFQTNATIQNRIFVSLVYFTILDRDADPGGYLYFDNALGSGLTQQGMLTDFLNSAEYANRTN